MFKNKISLGIGILLLMLMVASSVDASSAANLTEEYAFPKMKLSDWPHKHVFVQAGSGMKVLGNSVLVITAINHCLLGTSCNQLI